MRKWLSKFKKSSRKKKSGFTLLEVMMVSAILLLVVGSALTVLLTSTDFYDTASSDADFFTRGSFVMQQIISELSGCYYNTQVFRTVTSGSDFNIEFNPPTTWDTLNNRPNFTNGVYGTTSHTYPSVFAFNSTTGAITYTTGGVTQTLGSGIVGLSMAPGGGKAALWIITLTMSRTAYLSTGTETQTKVFRQDIHMLHNDQVALQP